MGDEFNMRRSRVECIRIFVGKAEGKESLRKPRSRQGNNITLDPKGKKMVQWKLDSIKAELYLDQMRICEILEKEKTTYFFHFNISLWNKPSAKRQAFYVQRNFVARRVTAVAVEIQKCTVGVVELHVTVNYTNILNISQQCFYNKFISPATITHTQVFIKFSMLYGNRRISEQFYSILYSYASHIVLLNFIVYIYIYITVLCPMFFASFCKHFWDP